MPDIVISEFMDHAAVESLAEDYDVLYDPQLIDHPDALLAAVGSARGLIVRNRTQVRGALLQVATKLKVVGRLGVGLDNIDLPTCEKRNVVVCPATGANDAAVAEYVIASAMILMRNAFAAGPDVIAGNWPRLRCIGREIGGKVLGLIGFGGIARETSRRARVLGMSVAAYDPFVDENDAAWDGVDRLTLGDLLRCADIVSLHLPLLESTKRMLDSTMLAQMKEGAVLIDTSRGGIVDERAVVEMLRAGRLSGAAFDVFENEPLTAESGARFAKLENLVLTPHIAGVTEESNARVSAATAENVRNVLTGS